MLLIGSAFRLQFHLEKLDVPEGECYYAIKLDFMRSLEVRPGYVPSSTRVRCAVGCTHVQCSGSKSAVSAWQITVPRAIAVRQRIVLYASKVCNVRRRRILFEGGQAGEYTKPPCTVASACVFA